MYIFFTNGFVAYTTYTISIYRRKRSPLTWTVQLFTQGAATVFLAQVFGMDLGLSALVLIVVTTVAASIGSPATPGVGMISDKSRVVTGTL